MVCSCCGGLVEELHGSAGHDRKEFFWLDEICCPKCSLDLPYLPSVGFFVLRSLWHLLVGELNQSPQLWKEECQKLKEL